MKLTEVSKTQNDAPDCSERTNQLVLKSIKMIESMTDDQIDFVLKAFKEDYQ